MSAATETATSELQSSLRELHIGENSSSVTDIARPKLRANTSVASKKKKPPVVADSWEDELGDDQGADADADEDADTNTNGISRRDDELASSGASAPDSLGTSPAVAEGPLDPPPTPLSPQTSQPWVTSAGAAAGGYGPTSSRSRSTSSSTPTAATAPGDQARRPEKQTAVAGRLIAGALGIRAPKMSEDQRAYDRAVKEQEIKRRRREKEEAARLKEEEERAKAAIWDD